MSPIFVNFSNNPSVSDFDEKGAVALGQANALMAIVVVSITYEKHATRVNIVGKKKLGEKLLVLRIDVKGVVFGIIVIIHILQDRAEEKSGTDLIDDRALADVGRVKAFPFYIHPLENMVKRHPDMSAERII